SGAQSLIEAVQRAMTAAAGQGEGVADVPPMDADTLMRELITQAALAPGAMVDFDRSPDDPVELLVGGRVIAKGEVVIVGGNYGVRILEVIGAAKLRQQMESVR
ncbi:MAG: hypothetical protein B7X11_06010, partial [Acidobacteria bacterium 37-65-4]